MYLLVENGAIFGKSPMPDGNPDIISVEVSDDIYNTWQFGSIDYIYSDGQIIPNPNYKADKQAKERQELDLLTLTPADVERALYKAKDMDFEDLKQFIAANVPTIDIKALAIEFRAKDFYRGATLADGTRLIDIVGALLGYNSADMDYLFLHKELPIKEEL